MGSAAYTFRMNRYRPNAQRGASSQGGDRDYAGFFLTLNGTAYAAQASAPTSGPGGGPGGQDPVNPAYGNGYMGPPLNVPGQAFNCVLLWDSGSVSDGKGGVMGGDADWAIGPLQIDDEDSVVVFYSIWNLSHDSSSQATAEYLKIVGGEYAVLGGVIALIPGGQIVGAVEAIVGGVLSLVGEIVGFLGGQSPNCDGLVASSPPFSFTGAQLETLVNTPVPSANVVSQFLQVNVNSGLTAGSPSGCGTPNTDVTWSILRDISATEIFGPVPPSMHMKMRPRAASSATSDWAGQWGDGKYLQDSRVSCVITATGNGVAGASTQERIASYVGGLNHSVTNEALTTTLLGQYPLATRSGALSIASIPSIIHADATKGTALVQPVTARYLVDATEDSATSGAPPVVEIASGNLVEIPMLATLFAQDIYPTDTHPIPIHLEAVKPAPGDALGITLPEPSNPAQKVGVSQGYGVALEVAASLVAAANVTLQLYGDYDPTGKLVGNSIRYLRTDTSGNVITDVMLAQVQNIPT